MPESLEGQDMVQVVRWCLVARKGSGPLGNFSESRWLYSHEDP